MRLLRLQVVGPFNNHLLKFLQMMSRETTTPISSRRLNQYLTIQIDNTHNRKRIPRFLPQNNLLLKTQVVDQSSNQIQTYLVTMTITSLKLQVGDQSNNPIPTYSRPMSQRTTGVRAALPSSRGCPSNTGGPMPLLLVPDRSRRLREYSTQVRRIVAPLRDRRLIYLGVRMLPCRPRAGDRCNLKQVLTYLVTEVATKNPPTIKRPQGRIAPLLLPTNHLLLKGAAVQTPLNHWEVC